MVDERAERLVAVEADAVEVGGLALVPAGGGGEIDDRGHAPAVRRDRLEADRAVRRRRAPCARARRRPTRAGRRSASRSRARRRRSRGTPPLIRSPARARATSELSGSQSAAAARPSRHDGRDAREHGDAAEARRRGRGRGAAPCRRSSRSARARGRGSRARAGARSRRPPRGARPAKPPATISTSLTKSGEGGSPASAPSETPIAAPRTGCVLPMPVTAWPPARGSCASSGVAA